MLEDVVSGTDLQAVGLLLVPYLLYEFRAFRTSVDARLAGIRDALDALDERLDRVEARVFLVPDGKSN
ncbi:MAG TPA: hypothetical protein PKV78_11595 [Methanoculleus thermophilus]|nr:hypothetical protein [Methanoculleus thermophilus]